MQFVSSKMIRVKLSVICVVVCFAVFAFFGLSARFEIVSAYSAGPPPSRSGAPGETNCTACHADFALNGGTGSVSISGLPANYLPNQTIAVTVTTSQSDAVLYGFQLTAIDAAGRQVGTFTVPGGANPQMQTKTGEVGNNTRAYVEHTVNGISPTQFGSKSWTFNWQTPAARVGKVSFYAAGNAANSDGKSSGDYIYTSSKATLSGTAISNFDGDGASDVAVYRPSTGIWYSLNSKDGAFRAFSFGQTGDKPAAGDFDGDGITDYAIYRTSNTTWYLQQSTAGFAALSFGTSSDVPVAGDYDGDGKTDIAVYRPSTGVWYVQGSRNGFQAFSFGAVGDKPVQGDYDGDGKTDFAVYRPSNGVWYVWKSTSGFYAVSFGDPNDLPVPGDYDGDGKIDQAVYRPSTATWYRLGSTAGFSAVSWGNATDKPVPGDYDGDGKTDSAVYRDGTWFVLKSSDGSYFSSSFGTTGDIPVPSNYIP